VTFCRTVADGLELRQFTLDDAEAIFAKVNRHRDYLREWLPWVDRTHGPENVRQFIDGAITQFEEGRGPSAGIWRGGEICGSLGCHPIDLEHRNSSIGYWIEPGLQGKGIVTRCCIAMLRHLFDDRGLHRVEIRCGTGNTRSCAIPERLGFRREGVAREAEWVNDRWVDLFVWSTLEDEWRRSPFR
jgi:ribosomal-protein-serine acetyltransferase